MSLVFVSAITHINYADAEAIRASCWFETPDGAIQLRTVCEWNEEQGRMIPGLIAKMPDGREVNCRKVSIADSQDQTKLAESRTIRARWS